MFVIIRTIQTLSVICKNDNTKVTHRKEVLEEIEKFYKILYISRREEFLDASDYLNSLDMPKLTDDEKLMLDKPLALEEVIEAIKSLQKWQMLWF